MQKFLRFFVVAIAFVSTTVAYAQSTAQRPTSVGTGFFVSGPKLYDANGNEFRIRGISKLFSFLESPGIANSHANAVEWNLNFQSSHTSPNQMPQTPADDVSLLLGKYVLWNSTPISAGTVASGQVVIPGNYSAAGQYDQASLNAAVDSWVNYASDWNKLERYDVITIAEDWGPPAYDTNGIPTSNWRDFYISAIQRMRSVGIHATLMVGTGGWQNDVLDLQFYANDVLNADPDHNLIFTVSANGWSDTTGNPAVASTNQWQPDIASAFSTLAQLNVPIVVKRISPVNQGWMPSNISPSRVIQLAEQYGFGWMTYYWDARSLPVSAPNPPVDSPMSVAENYQSTSDLTPFGQTIIETPNWGLKALATQASIFTVATTPWITRTDTHQLLEPSGDHVLIDAGQDYASSTIAFGQATGANPAMYMTYLDSSDNPLNVKEWAESNKNVLDSFGEMRILQIGYNFCVSSISPNTSNCTSLADIASGAYDSNLTAVCSALNYIHRPVIIRIGNEFNGHWNGYDDRSGYIAAFRHTATALKNCGVPVAAAWVYSLDENDPSRTDYTQWFPGNDVVDWYGLNVFAQIVFNNPNAESFLNYSVSNQKPVIVGEATPRNGTSVTDSTWNDFFLPYLNFIHAHPSIKVFDYINDNWDPVIWPGWGNARIPANSLVANNLTTEFLQEKYLKNETPFLLNQAINMGSTTWSAFDPDLYPSLVIPLLVPNPTNALQVSRSGPATFLNSAGIVTQAPANTPRYDYQNVPYAGIYPQGLLVEPAATNSCPYSGAMNNAFYMANSQGIVASPVSASVTTAPDGSGSAVSYTEDNSNGPHQIVLNPTNWSNNVPFTFSTYIKMPNSNSEFVFAISVQSVGSYGQASVTFNGAGYAIYTLPTIYSGAESNTVATSEPLPNGWYRFTVSGVMSNTTGLQPEITFQGSSGSSYAGNGVQNLYVWGAQLEVGTLATSYIPTTSAPATRSADLVSLTTDPSWYNSNAGTFILQGTPNFVSSAGSTALFSALSSNDSYGMNTNSMAGNTIVFSDQASGVSSSVGGPLSVNTPFTVGVAYDSSSTHVSTNATLGAPAQGLSLPVSTFNLGQDRLGGSNFSGHLSEFIYYNSKLNDSTLQRMTP